MAAPSARATSQQLEASPSRGRSRLAPSRAAGEAQRCRLASSRQPARPPAEAPAGRDALAAEAFAKFKPGSPKRLAAAGEKAKKGSAGLTFGEVLYALEGDFELEGVVERRGVIQHHDVVHLNLCHIGRAGGRGGGRAEEAGKRTRKQ